MKNSSVRKLTNQVNHFLEKRDDRKVKSFLVKHNFHVIAKVINELVRGKLKTFALLPPEIQADVALALSTNSKNIILPKLSDYTFARFLHFNDEDDAVDILQFLPSERRSQILEKLREAKRKKIEKLLKYHPKTAGGLMDLNFIIVKPEFEMRDVADKVQRHTEKEKQAPLVIVSDEKGKTKGYVPYKNLILSSPKMQVRQVIQPLPIISYKTDQENILDLIIKGRNEVVGVVDENENILGIIHVKDLVKIVQAEATEDVYRFAGVSLEEDVLTPPSQVVKRRYKWLLVNLITAFIAASVVSLFEETISKMAVLAVYMPVVAGMGGNAGTQALAVAVRGLALGEVSWYNAKQIIFKEITAGVINGIIVGIGAGLIVIAFSGRIELALVLAFSMVVTLFVAGFFGAIIPLSLKAFGVDPAVASSVFVTTATDIFGFLAFLGLATIVLL